MPTYLVRERFQDFAVHPTDPKTLSVEVEPGVLLSNTGAAISGIADSSNYGSAQALGAISVVRPFAPAAPGNLRRDLIAIATDLSIHILTGVEIATPGPAVAPVIPANLVPLAEISVTDITTQIESTNIQDIRPFLTSHQDRTRQIRVESLLPGTTPPYSGTSAGFITTNFLPSVDRDAKFSITIPEDFDYNREMKLYLRGYTGGAGGIGDIEWRITVYRVAAGAAAGAYPPAPLITDTIFNVNNDFSAEAYAIRIASSLGLPHFALRVLKPGDVLAFNIMRRGSALSDTYLAPVSIVEVSINYNIGYSVYPG